MITPEMIRRAAAALADGQLVVAPTDTVYGVCAHPGLPMAIERLYTVKGRPDNKPIPLLISDPTALAKIGVHLTEPEQRLTAAFWPGPLTLIVDAPEGSEGVRVPDHPAMQDLLRAVGGVLRVTSANRSGDAPALTAGEARKALGKQVDLILDGGPVTGGEPSSVARIVGAYCDVLREGAISKEKLQKAMGSRLLLEARRAENSD